MLRGRAMPTHLNMTSYLIQGRLPHLMGTLQRGVRNVLRSPVRLVLVVAILGTSLMFVTAMFALNASAQQRLANARGQIGSGIDVRPAGSFGPFGSGGTLTADQVTAISNTSGVVGMTEQVTAQYDETLLKGTVTAPTNTGTGGTTGTGGGGNGFGGGGDRFSDNGTMPPTIYGLTPGQTQYTLLNGVIAKLADGRDLGTSETTADVALTSTALATANNLTVGSTFTLKGTTFTLVGTYSTGSTFGDNTFILPIQTAQAVYAISGVSTVIVYASDDDAVTGLVDRLKSALGSGVDVTAQSAQFTQTLTALKDAQGNIFTTLVVSIVTAALVILFAVLLIVRERTREIGLLKAIGASHWQVISQFVVEVVSLSGIAAIVAALLLGIAGGALASKFDITSTTGTRGAGGFGGAAGGGFRGFGGAAQTVANQSPLSAGLTPGTFLLVLAIGVGLAVLASVIPAWYVSRIKPAQVLRAD